VKESTIRPRTAEVDTEYRRVMASKKGVQGGESQAERIAARHGDRFEVEREDNFRVVFREPRAQHEARVRKAYESRARVLGDLSDSKVDGQTSNVLTRKGPISLKSYVENVVPDRVETEETD